MHVSKGSIDSTLSSHRMGSGREQLRDAGGLEASFGETEGSSETSSSSSDHNGIVLMVDDGIISNQFLALKWKLY
jgi:hypothetical protein